jgi:hypothetical protein
MTLRLQVRAAACVAVFAISGLPLASASAADGDAAAPDSLWCVALAEKAAENELAGQIVRADHELCAGRAAAAADILTKILQPVLNTHELGFAWFDFHALYLYALIASNRADAAARYLRTDIDATQRDPAERAFFDGKYADSFAAYLAEDDQLVRSPDQRDAHKLSPYLQNAAADLRAGELPDAIAEDLADGEDASLYLLMKGDLFAQARRWPEAFSAWVAAASRGSDAPGMEIVSTDQWNADALDMIYYYRAHAPAHEAADPFTCDLAKVESLALRQPAAAGLDASRIMDAATRSDPAPGHSTLYARVDLESKGSQAMYFGLEPPSTWTVLNAAPSNVVFPNARFPNHCQNASFVNHPSGP